VIVSEVNLEEPRYTGSFREIPERRADLAVTDLALDRE
jgi:hypothetical protein